MGEITGKGPGSNGNRGWHREGREREGKKHRGSPETPGNVPKIPEINPKIPGDVPRIPGINPKIPGMAPGITGTGDGTGMGEIVRGKISGSASK